MGFLKQASLRWSPAFRQLIFCWSSRFAIRVSEYFPDHNRIFVTTGFLYDAVIGETELCILIVVLSLVAGMIGGNAEV